jgi:WD40 repeat protein
MATHDQTALVLDGRTGSRLARTAGHHTDVINSVAFSPDGEYFATASQDGSVRIWTAGSGREVQLLTHDIFIDYVAFSPDGMLLVTVAPSVYAWVWDLATGRSMPGTHETDTVMGMSEDGRVALVGRGTRTCLLVETASGRRLSQIEDNPEKLRTVAISRDGGWLLTARFDDDQATVWRGDSGERVATLRGHTDDVHSASFSADGKRVVTASARELLVWDTATWRMIRRLRVTENNLYLGNVAFGPDSKSMGVGNLSYLRNLAWIWHEDSVGAGGSDLTGADMSPHSELVNTVRFSPDGIRVVTASDDRTAEIRNAYTGELIAVLRGHTGEVESAAFSPDGKLVVTAGRDRTARVWVAATGELVDELRGSDDPLQDAVFSSDGRFIHTADGTVRTFECDVCGSFDKLLARAESRAPRKLTGVERNTYLHEQ